jgi:hypothetical protein
MEEGEELGGAMAAAINLAAASDLDLARASDVVAVAMATFGYTGEEVVRVANSFVQAADASVSEVSDLARSMKNVGPTAAAFGWSIETTNTALGILSERGIKGAAAGTALKSMMTNMMRPVDHVVKSLDALNVELYDSEGSMRDLPDILADLEQGLYGVNESVVQVNGRTKEQNEELERLQKIYDSTLTSIGDYESGVKGASLTEEARAKKIADLNTQLEATGLQVDDLLAITGDYVTVQRQLTEEERNQYIQSIAGAYGMKSLVTLLTEGKEGWAEMTENIANAATVQQVAAIRADTLAGSWEAFEGVIETFLITAGDKLLPVLQDVLTWIADWISEKGPAVADAFGEWVASLEPLVRWLVQAFTQGTLLQEMFAMLPEPIQKIAAWFQEKLPQAIAFLATAYNDYLLPAFAAVQVFITDTLVPVFMVVYNWFTQFLPVAIQVLVDYYNAYLLPAFLMLAQEWEMTLLPALTQLWSWLQERVPQAIEWLANVWDTVLKPVIQFFGMILAGYVIPILAQLAAWLITNIPVAIDWLVQAWQNVLWPALQDVWAWITENIFPGFVLLYEWLAEVIPLAIEQWKVGWYEVLWPALQEVWAWIQEYLIPVFVTIWEWLGTNVPLAIATLTAFWEETLWPAMQAVWAWITETLLPTISELWTWLQETLTAAIQTLTDFWETVLLPALEAVWAFITDYLAPLAESLIELLEVTMAKALEFLAAAWENILLPALELIYNYWVNTLGPIFEVIREWLEETLATAIEDLTELWEETLLPALQAVWKYLSENVVKIFEELHKFWVESLQPAIEKVAEVIEDVLLEAWKSLKEKFGKKDEIEGVATAFDNIKKAVEKAKEWIDKAKAAIEAIKIPGWLEGHSPPPMATWFDEISRAAEQMATMAMPQVAAAMEIAAPSPMTAMGPPLTNIREGDKFDIKASYAQQDEKTLRQDIEFMQLRQRARGE